MKKYTEDELKALDPVAYAKEWNAARKAEGADSWMMLPEEPEYYIANGYDTAYDYEKSCAFDTLSDVFKEINGFRPRGIYDLAKASLADVEAEIKSLLDGEKARVEAKEAEKVAVAARIAEAITPVALTYNPFAALKGVL